MDTRDPTSRPPHVPHLLFLRELAKDGVVSRAAAVAGLTPSTVYEKRRRDPGFAMDWEDAIEEAVDKLELEAWRRAVDGTDKGVYHQGALVATEKQYSDSLLALMLKAKRKAYRDNSKVELTGANGGPLQTEEVSPLAAARKIAFVLALGVREKAAQDSAPSTGDGTDLA